MNRDQDKRERLAGLAVAHQGEINAAEAVLVLVKSSRMAGATWQEIGEALGVSRQAAQQRYGDKMGYWLSVSDD
jgi:hypothetical protein